MRKGEQKNERMSIEEKYKALVGAAPDAIFTLDLLGRFTFVNRAAETISGYSKEEVVGKHFRELLPLKHIPACLNVFQRALRGQPTSPIEIEMITKEGERVPLELLGRPVKRGRRVVEILGIAREITERKQAEEALQESEERYHTIFEQAADSIVLVDAETGALVEFNDRAHENLGYTREEFQNLKIPDFEIIESAEEVAKHMKKVVKEGTDTFETKHRTKSGEIRDIQVNSRVISIGERDFFQSIFRDITERKRAEEEIRRRSEELVALYDVSLDVAAQLDLDTLLKTVLLKARELLRGNAVGLYLYDPERQELELIVHQGLTKDYTGTRLALGEGACGKVAQSGDTLVVTDYTNWEGRSPHFDEEPTFNVLAVPIKRGDALLGALYVDDPDVERRFEEGDVHLATLFANQAAIAIQNAQLFEESQRRGEEIAALRQVSLATLSTLEREQVFEIMLDQLGTVIDYDTAAIKIITPDGKDKMIAGRGPVIYDQAMWNGFDVKDNKLVQEMKETKQAVVVHDAQIDERYTRVGDWEAFRSWVGAPLFVKDDFVGYLAVEKTYPGFYDEKAVQLLGDFASGAAIALENARLYEEAQKRLAETTVLHEVAEVINSTLDLKEVFQRVVEELSNAFDYRLVDMYLLEEEGLRLQAQVGYDAETTIDFTPLERGVVGRVARTGQPAFIRDVSQDPDYISSYPDITNEICVPIKSGETLLGVLNVECDAKSPLTEDDLQLLVTLSSHIAVAIDNARLYQEVQARRVYLETLQRINATLRSTLPLREVLDTIVRAATEALGYVGSFIAMPDATGECLTLGAAWGGRIVDAALRVTRFKLESFSVPVKVQENLIARAFVRGELQAATGNPEAMAVGTEPSISGKMASAIERISGAKGTACVPLRVGEKSVGVLIIVSPREQLADDERAMLLGLADQAGLAIQNARLYEESQQLAITDGLTGLYNLRYFYETLEKEIQRSERYHRSVSLIILDIDDFKAYNDLYGHLAGDDLLIKLTQLISKVTRQTDTLARYGGEEFVIILPETETEGARVLAERLQEGVREHRFSIQDGQTIGRITISLGVATYPHHADSAKALVDAADKALLGAKRAGKNRLFTCGEELTELEPR